MPPRGFSRSAGRGKSCATGASGYVTTPSADPVYLYADLLIVAILPERNLNNGQPSLHAWLIAGAAPRPGEHIVHIGAGVGYYTAILARLVGRRGKVTAIEYDAEPRSPRATRTIWPMRRRLRVVHGDGTEIDFAPADVIYVNAGATHPAPYWLDRLAEGGRLILPLTAADFPSGDIRHGAVFRIERRGDELPSAADFGGGEFPSVPVPATRKPRPRSPPPSEAAAPRGDAALPPR